MMCSKLPLIVYSNLIRRQNVRSLSCRLSSAINNYQQKSSSGLMLQKVTKLPYSSRVLTASKDNHGQSRNRLLREEREKIAEEYLNEIVESRRIPTTVPDDKLFVVVLKLAGNLDTGRMDKFIEIGSTYLVDSLIKAASQPAVEKHNKWPFSSFYFLRKIDKISSGKLTDTLGEKKMLQLIGVLSDRLLSTSFDVDLAVILLEDVAKTFLIHNFGKEILPKIQKIADLYIEALVQQGLSTNREVGLLENVYKILPIPREPLKVEKVMNILARDMKTSDPTMKKENPRCLICHKVLSYGDLLIRFSTLYMPCVSAQLEIWLEARQRLPREYIFDYNKLFAVMFVELCLRLDRLDLLAQRPEALEAFKSEEMIFDKPKLLEALNEAKCLGAFVNNRKIYSELMSKLS